MLVGLRVAFGPLIETLAVRVTVPLKPARGVTVIVEVPAEPVAVKRYAGFGDTAKPETPVMLAMNVAQQLRP
jgi:hypothetical protein